LESKFLTTTIEYLKAISLIDTNFDKLIN